MAKTITKGNCYLCGHVYSKTGMRTHLQKESSTMQQEQLCYLLKIEAEYDTEHWLYLDIPVTSMLSSLDKFLRKIWLECCGHLSMFYLSEYDELSMSTKLHRFQPGEKIHYEYDFGSTTHLTITIVSTIARPTQKKAVRLLARNEPLHFSCATCGAEAAFICKDSYPDKYLCENCNDLDVYDFVLPVTNSPRSGECGYCGELDIYEFSGIPTKISFHPTK